MLEPFAYTDDQAALSGLIARPRGTPRAAVVVYPTIMNVTPVVEAKALALAEAGYITLIADFYAEPPSDMAHSRALATALRADVDAYRTRLKAAIDALAAASPGVPLVTIGFCMGGQASLEMARINAPIVLAASFHGLLDTARPASERIVPRILVCHGDADPLVPRAQVTAFWEEMDRAEANWHFHAYSRVRHGFTNPTPPGDNPAVAYDASANRQSWAALLSLLDEILN